MESHAAPDWRLPLLAVLATSAVAALLLRLVPTLAPEFVVEFGWPEGSIGALTSTANFGSLLFMAIGTGVMRAIGAIRSMRLGLVAGGIGAAILTLPLLWTAAIGSLVVGLGHSPTHPAGNDIMRRYAPERHRTLAFSLKQSSVSIGGVVAGLSLPVIAHAFGLRAAIVFAVLLSLIALAATEPFRRRAMRQNEQDGEGLHGGMLSIESITGPVREVRASRALRRLALLGFLLAIVQSAWFGYLTSYLVLGLGYALTTAGLMFALMQGTSVLGRVLFGWCADHLVSGTVLLRFTCVASAIATAALGFAAYLPSSAYVTGVSLMGGLAVASWSGVHLTEALRDAGHERVYEATSGVVLAVGTGVTLGPIIFSGLLAITGDWSWSLSLTAVAPLLALAATRHAGSPTRAG